MYSHVGRFAIVFVGVDEVCRVTSVLLCEFEVTKEPLKLDQQVIVDLATSPLTPNFILLVDRFQQKIPKLGNHINLL